MRSFLHVLGVVLVVGLAYWAYKENYATQDAMRRVDDLQRQIGTAREELGVLRVEWAYLNRPERLRDLVDLNYPSLGLMPLAPEHFGEIAQVAFPRINPDEVSAPVDTIAEINADTAPVTPMAAPVAPVDDPEISE